jgi:hypothetical protein
MRATARRPVVIAALLGRAFAFATRTVHRHRFFAERSDHRAAHQRFGTELDKSLARAEVKRAMQPVTAWARDANLLVYDAKSRRSRTAGSGADR